MLILEREKLYKIEVVFEDNVGIIVMYLLIIGFDVLGCELDLIVYIEKLGRRGEIVK